jgi:hypothetical protein
VTLQAGIAAIELRRLGCSIKAVKDHALPRVKRGHFEQIATTDKSHHDVVTEVKRPRIPRVDPRRLEAGFRENQHLRIRIHIERLQNRPQISVLARLEPLFPVRQILG